MDKLIEHTSIYGTELSDDENAESMMEMFVNLPADVITQGVSKIHEEFSKFFYSEYFEGTLEEQDSPLAFRNVLSFFRIGVHHSASHRRTFEICN
jgi:hypothetical protein